MTFFHESRCDRYRTLYSLILSTWQTLVQCYYHSQSSFFTLQSYNVYWSKFDCDQQSDTLSSTSISTKNTVLEQLLCNVSRLYTVCLCCHAVTRGPVVVSICRLIFLNVFMCTHTRTRTPTHTPPPPPPKHTQRQRVLFSIKYSSVSM